MKKTNILSPSDARFNRAYSAALDYASLVSTQICCSKGALKRWEDLFMLVSNYSKKNNTISPIRLALDSLHWGVDHTNELKESEAELVHALLDELQNGTDAIKNWRHNSTFTSMVEDTLSSSHPLGKHWRWVYTDYFFYYLRNKTLDTLFYKEVTTQNIDLSISSNYEIKFYTRAARTRHEWQAFEISIHRLLPEVVDWPIQKQRNERALLRAFKERYNVDYENHHRDFGNLMRFLNALWSNGPYRLSSFLDVHTFSSELAFGIWPHNTQQELESLFLQMFSQIVRHKNHAESNPQFMYHYDCHRKQLCGSWLFDYISALHMNGKLTEKNQLKISKALMELSMGLL